MPRLHLGVIDVPYVEAPPKRRKAAKGKRKKVRRRKGGAGRHVTTGDVAGFLENRYHVMEHFWQIHGQQGADALAESAAGALESLMMGAPAGLDPFGGGISRIEDLFKQMLSGRELDALGYPGIPTEAAQMGHSKRFKDPRKRRPPRPSFIDTGLYQASFKAWMD